MKCARSGKCSFSKITRMTGIKINAISVLSFEMIIISAKNNFLNLDHMIL